MQGDRKELHDNLVRSALTQAPEDRASFLAASCEDPGIYHQVTRTLERLSSDPSVILHSDASALFLQQTAISRIGTTIGVYRITERLGAGGMGEVYCALDTRLGRNVALKFLPPAVTGNEAVVRRFQQEARTASALNHPNILTIYEMGQDQGEYFIAGEWIDGTTLRARLRQGSISIPEALDIAIQIASALVASHEAGVVHRDLKPANIMLRRDGYVKVIDFGLAKLTEDRHSRLADASDPFSEAVTRPGIVIGTLEYMSPEQARGRDVDQRTDIWSVGVIFYEMLSGMRPFRGDTDSHVIVAILDHKLPPFPSGRTIDRALAAILGRCLAKNAGDRYPTARELLEDLRERRQSAELGRVPTKTLFRGGPSQQKSRWLKVGLIASLLVVAACVFLAVRSRYSPMQTYDFQNVLTFNGQTSLASISPDGKWLAYVISEPGKESLWVKQIESGAEMMRLPPADVSYKGLTFSPDNQSLYYVQKDANEYFGRLLRISLLQDDPQSVLDDIDGPVTFSGNGDQFAFVRYAIQNGRNTSQIVVASKNDPNAQTKWLSSKDEIGRRIAWSPKENLIAFTKYEKLNKGLRTLIGFAGPNGMKTSIPKPTWGTIGQMQWLPNGRDMIASVSLIGQTRHRAQLRQLNTSTSEDSLVSHDLAGFQNVSLSRDGSKVTAIRLETRSRIWISDSDRSKSGRYINADSEQVQELDWIGNNRLVESSIRSGTLNLWQVNSDGTHPRRLTSGSHMDDRPTWLPGSDSVVFSSNRGDAVRSIWKLNLTDGRMVKLTPGTDQDYEPVSTADGKWVIYSSWPDAKPSLWKVPSEGGTPVRIGNYAAINPHVSPNSKWIAFRQFDNAIANHLTIADLQTGKQLHSLKNISPLEPFEWSPNSDDIVYSLTRNGFSNLWAQRIDGGSAKQITKFVDRQIIHFAWSPDGRLACLRGNRGQDVVLLKTRD